MYIGPLERFEEHLPWHGLGTDNLEMGVRMLSAQYLIHKAIVQFNAKHSIAWMAYDIDRDTARFDWDDLSCAPPNIVALSRQTGHAHYLYGIDPAVHAYSGANSAPLRYLGSIDVAMTEELGADRGYSKLLAKNPLHNRWDVLTPRIELYNLDELASWVDLEQYRDQRRRLPEVGYGRNCTLFERTRLKAYRMRREDWLGEEFFHSAVLGVALTYNAAFTAPLPHSEVRHTAKSISKWTWTHMSPEGFIERQRALGKRSGQARAKKAAELRERILRTIDECPTLTQPEVAALCGCSERTVRYHLKPAVNHIR